MKAPAGGTEMGQEAGRLQNYSTVLNSCNMAQRHTCARAAKLAGVGITTNL